MVAWQSTIGSTTIDTQENKTQKNNQNNVKAVLYDSCMPEPNMVLLSINKLINGVSLFYSTK